jgi:hypothetical protein
MTELSSQHIALQKLSTVLGDEQARTVLSAVMAEVGLAGIASPDEMLRFANALLKRRGVLAAIARSLKIHAILQGATAID